LYGPMLTESGAKSNPPDLAGCPHRPLDCYAVYTIYRMPETRMAIKGCRDRKTERFLAGDGCRMPQPRPGLMRSTFPGDAYDVEIIDYH
jgi:hypothetical protein